MYEAIADYVEALDYEYNPRQVAEEIRMLGRRVHLAESKNDYAVED